MTESASSSDVRTRSSPYGASRSSRDVSGANATREHAEDSLVVAEGIAALGGVVPNDGRLSWCDGRRGGFLPINVYLVTQRAAGLVIDTGVAAHQALVLAQLSRETRALSQLGIVITRPNEFESIGNVTEITKALNVTRVYAHPPTMDWISVDPLYSFDTGVETDLSSLGPGDCLAVDEAGDRVLTVIDPHLRLLRTTWLFDGRTRTLFTSDAFGHVLLPTQVAARYVDIGTDRTTEEDVRSAIIAKFDWLQAADVTAVSAGIDEFFRTNEVAAIAPTVGAIICGREAVERHVGMVLRVLEDLPRARAYQARSVD